MSNNTHTKFLKNCSPHQIPENFKIQPVPNVICSFVTSILLLLPVKQQRLMQQKPSELAHSNAGWLSCLVSDSKKSSSMNLTNSNRISLCQPSPKPLESRLSIHQIEKIWWKEQSVPPSHMWHRPSGQATGQIPDWTWTVRHASSCNNSSEDIAIKMAPNESRKHYQ